MAWLFLWGKEEDRQAKEIHYYKLFRDVCKVINSSLDLKEVLKLITENIVTALDVKACTVFLWDRKRNTLELSAARGLSETYLHKGPLDADKSIAETLKGQIVIISDAAADPRVQYPDAADTLDGVAQWRLSQRAVQFQLDQVKQALEALVAKGLINMQKGSDVKILYRANQGRSPCRSGG